MKRLTAWILTIVVIAANLFAFTASAEIQLKIETPHSVKYKVYDDGYCERVNVSCVLSEAFTNFSLNSAADKKEKYGMENVTSFLQLDYSIDNGEWHYSSLWDSQLTAPTFYVELHDGDCVRATELFYLNDPANRELAGGLCKRDSKKTNDGSDHYVFDLDNHTLRFRLRVAVNYYVGAESRLITSEWSTPITVRRDADFGKAPTTLEKPVLRDAKVKYDEYTEMPYLALRFDTPESVKEAEGWLMTQALSQIDVDAVLTVKDSEKNVKPTTQIGYASDEEKYIMLDSSDCDDARTVKLKIRYLTYIDDKPYYSPYSDEISFDVPHWTEEDGVTYPICPVCGLCHPEFGLCIFVWIGIFIFVLLIAGILVLMKVKKIRARKAKEEEERQKQIAAEQEARRKLKEEKKLKNKKSNQNNR